MVIKITNTMVNFDSLPEKYKTDEIRKFYDRDNSGQLELKNENNENEIALFEKAFGISLKKYYVNETAYDEGGIGFSRTYRGQYGTAIHHSKRDNIGKKTPMKQQRQILY